MVLQKGDAMRHISNRRSWFMKACVTTLLFTAFSAFVAYGYEKNDKPIRSISLTVSGLIKVEEKFGEEELEVHTAGNKYSFDHYEVQNAGFRWSIEDTPELEIYLTASDGYYFRITKASQIRLNGASYKSARREDGAYTLVVRVTLPSLEAQVGTVEEAVMEGGRCRWSEAIGAGSYELKFMRNGTTLGANQIINGTSYDGSEFMTRGASYHFKVRAINAKDPSIKGHWTDSNQVSITEAQAREQKARNAELQSAGEWIEEEGRWWFRLPDQSCVRSTWRQINGEWYLFDENGWMRTGWYLDGDKWYYLDPESGVMWKNATTEDGYHLGIDGVLQQN